MSLNLENLWSPKEFDDTVETESTHLLLLLVSAPTGASANPATAALLFSRIRLHHNYPLLHPVAKADNFFHSFFLTYLSYSLLCLLFLEYISSSDFRHFFQIFGIFFSFTFILTRIINSCSVIPSLGLHLLSCIRDFATGPWQGTYFVNIFLFCFPFTQMLKHKVKRADISPAV